MQKEWVAVTVHVQVVNPEPRALFPSDIAVAVSHSIRGILRVAQEDGKIQSNLPLQGLQVESFYVSIPEDH